MKIPPTKAPNPDALVLSILGNVYPEYMKTHPGSRQGLIFVIENMSRPGETDFEVNVVVTTIDELFGSDKIAARLPEAHATVLLAAASTPITFGVLYLTPTNVCSYEILHADVMEDDGATSKPIWIAPSVSYLH